MSKFDPDSKLIGKFVDRETGNTVFGMATFLKHVTAAGGPVAYTKKMRQEGYVEGYPVGVEDGRKFERGEIQKMIDQSVQKEIARAMAARDAL